MRTQEDEVARQIDVIHGQIDELHELVGGNVVLIKQEGQVLAEQNQQIADLIPKMDAAHGDIERAREKIQVVSELTNPSSEGELTNPSNESHGWVRRMAAKNYIAWGLTVLFLVATVIVWAV
jgi:uncharacterized protein (DUF885 family)